MFSYYCVSFLLYLLLKTCQADPDNQCHCGYRDDVTGSLYTDSTIAYFNETGVESHEFTRQSFKHHSERSWNALYRQGAAIQNVVPGSQSNTAALRLVVDPPTKNHIVVGGGIRTPRQDILYGTFRTFLRSPRPVQNGGSVLTMAVQHDDTESFSFNLMNTNNPSAAWISMLTHGEFPTRASGVTYKDLIVNATADAGAQDPWNFLELRIDWDGDGISYFINGNLTRSVKKGSQVEQTPSSFYLRHWSTGDRYVSQGPPLQQTFAEIGWTRLFFNSSLMDLVEHQKWDHACRNEAPCSIQDWTLRNSSSYGDRAVLPWKVTSPKAPKRVGAIVVSILSVAVTVILLLHAAICRQSRKSEPVIRSRSPENLSRISVLSVRDSFARASLNRVASGVDLHTLIRSSVPSTYAGATATPGSYDYRDRDSRTLFPILTPSRSVATSFVAGATSTSPTLIERAHMSHRHSSDAIDTIVHTEDKEKKGMPEMPDDQPTTNPATPKKLHARWLLFSPDPTIDQDTEYLAGLLVICSIIIAVIDFGLTFIPALIQPDGIPHYGSEAWARKIITPFFLSFNWVGPLITISARYLAINYLRCGNLEDIACKVVCQVPRLLLPAFVMTLIQYFLINSGITVSLIRLSSLTWSEWPFVTTYDNFANWLTELIELAYLLPNAAPALTYHYCTGVLWIIPVLLQFSWNILLGVVLVREITIPWKRAAYYLLAITTNWYARSWGTFLWTGLLLADLEVLYNYKILLNRQWTYAAVLATFIAFILLGVAPDMVAGWTGYNFSWAENSIHPDILTALPLSRTVDSGYPPYYVPRISVLSFATGIYGVVQICPPVQRLLSSKLMAKLAPHALGIYLLHGVIYWSWGAWATVRLSGDLGLPYWSVLLIVALTSLTFLALALPLVTPVLSTLERNLTALLWHSAVIEPPRKRKTLFPFEPNLLQHYENYQVIPQV